MTEALAAKKDELTEQKVDAERHREDLIKQARLKEDTLSKKIQQKLEREKSDEKKKLQTEMQMLDESNAEAKTKLHEEIRKHEQLLSDRQSLEENFKRKTEKKAEDTEVGEEQDAKILELKQLIEDEQVKDNEQTEESKKAEKLNKIEENKARDLAQLSAALKAKLSYIMNTYDYKQCVMSVREDVLTKVIKRNEDVNKKLESFKTQIETTQNETKEWLGTLKRDEDDE